MSVRLLPHRTLLAFAAGVLAISTAGACSAESLAEFGLEKVVEANADGDVDIDFSDGGLTVTTDEGDIDFSFDEGDGTGSIVFESDEGSGSVTFDDEGNIVYDTDEGSGTITVDDNGIQINDDEQGHVTIAGNGDGTGTLTSDSTQAAFGLDGPPDGWPTEIGVPDTINADATTYSQFQQGDKTTLIANFTHDPNEDFATSVIDRLISDGWNADLNASEDESVFAQFSNGDRIALVVADDVGLTHVTVQL